MKTLILAGGSGSRLRSKISDVPKPMAPVAGRPFLEWQLMLLKVQGFTDIVLCVGYLSDKIIDYFGDGSKLGMNIQYSVENKPLGTVGAIKNASQFIDGTFLLLNGDTFFDMDFRGIAEFHDAKEAALSLSLIMAEDATRYGVVAVDINGRVTRFEDKKSDTPDYGYINAGVYVVESALLDQIPPDKPTSFENDIIPEVVTTGKVYGYISDGFFINVDTPDDYETAQALFAQLN